MRVTVLLSEVGNLSVIEVEFVHEGLAVKQVIERFISNLKESRSQTEKTSLQKGGNPACEIPTVGIIRDTHTTNNSLNSEIYIKMIFLLSLREANKPVTVAGRGSASSSHVSKIFLYPPAGCSNLSSQSKDVNKQWSELKWIKTPWKYQQVTSLLIQSIIIWIGSHSSQSSAWTFKSFMCSVTITQGHRVKWQKLLNITS